MGTPVSEPFYEYTYRLIGPSPLSGFNLILIFIVVLVVLAEASLDQSMWLKDGRSKFKLVSALQLHQKKDSLQTFQSSLLSMLCSCTVPMHILLLLLDNYYYYLLPLELDLHFLRMRIQSLNSLF